MRVRGSPLCHLGIGVLLRSHCKERRPQHRPILHHAQLDLVGGGGAAQLGQRIAQVLPAHARAGKEGAAAGEQPATHAMRLTIRCRVSCRRAQPRFSPPRCTPPPPSPPPPRPHLYRVYLPNSEPSTAITTSSPAPRSSSVLHACCVCRSTPAIPAAHSRALRSVTSWQTRRARARCRAVLPGRPITSPSTRAVVARPGVSSSSMAATWAGNRVGGWVGEMGKRWGPASQAGRVRPAGRPSCAHAARPPLRAHVRCVHAKVLAQPGGHVPGKQPRVLGQPQQQAPRNLPQAGGRAREGRQMVG